MKRFALPVLYVVVGFTLGVAMLMTSAHLQARQFGRPERVDTLRLQTDLMNQPEIRLVQFPAPRGKSRLEMRNGQEVLVSGPHAWAFVKDVRTNACWLAALDANDQATSLAVAPSEACQ